MIPNLAISVSSLPKAGKNHFAYSAPDPIKVYCFNGGASFVATKFPTKKIEVHNFVLPIIESEEQKWALPVWEEFYKEYNQDIKAGVFATYVLDTGTEVESFCRQATLEELQEVAEEHNKVKRKLATNEYLARNLRMNAIFARARNSGVNLITLQYLKEQWLKEKGQERAEPTGVMVLDGWTQTTAQADINLELVQTVKGRKATTLATIKSNRFDPDMNGYTLENPSFNDVVALLLGE